MDAVSPLSRIPELDEEECSFALRELGVSFEFSPSYKHNFQKETLFPLSFRLCELKECWTVLKNVFLNVSKSRFCKFSKKTSSTELFFSIPEEFYRAELRKAANDDFLSKVASILNPSYHTFTQWGQSSREVRNHKIFYVILDKRRNGNFSASQSVDY